MENNGSDNVGLALQLVQNTIAADIVRKLWDDPQFRADVTERAKTKIVALILAKITEVGASGNYGNWDNNPFSQLTRKVLDEVRGEALAKLVVDHRDQLVQSVSDALAKSIKRLA